jgi:hypothetical protein
MEPALMLLFFLLRTERRKSVELGSNYMETGMRNVGKRTQTCGIDAVATYRLIERDFSNLYARFKEITIKRHDKSTHVD